MNINGNVKNKLGEVGRFNRFTQKAVADLSNPKALAPVILLETSVITGRCHHAEERGGWVELRERFLEETLTAAVWFFGITTLNKIGDKILEKVHLDTTIDVGKDKVPDEFGKLKDYMKGPLERFTDGKSTRFKNNLTKIKFAKIILSTLTGIYLVGHVIPKFKNSVTENAKAHPEENSIKAALLCTLFDEEVSPANNNQIQTGAQNAGSNISSSMNKFLDTTKNSSVKFRGALTTLSHNLENDNIYKMLTVDTGIVAGRATNARNDDERIEIVVRDVGSLYFYIASTHHVANFLSNGLKTDQKMGISTKLDPRIAAHMNEEIFKEFNNFKKKSNTDTMSKAEFNEFMTKVFGKDNDNLVKTLKEQSASTNHTMNLEDFLEKTKHAENFKFIRSNAVTAAKLNNQIITGGGLMRISRNLEELHTTDNISPLKLRKFFSNESERIFENTAKGIIDTKIDNNKILEMIDEFINLDTPVKKGYLREQRKKEINEARKLKEYIKVVKPDGNFVVTAQIDDIVHDGLVRDQSFLKNSFSISYPEINDPKKYVSLKNYAKTRANIENYANCLKVHMEKTFKDSNDVSLTDLKNELGKYRNKNLAMKAVYISAGLGVSAYFLSTVIPKFQTYITEKRTGKSGFPGAREINSNKVS